MEKKTDPYYDYKNSVLKNKLGLTCQKELTNYENQVVSYRRIQLENKMFSSTEINISELKNIHYCLFQDVYDWAGQFRTINISKGKNPFFPYQLLDKAMNYLDTQIKIYLNRNNPSLQIACKDLAHILLDINHMHAFREGNGRTQREFVRILASLKGYELTINNTDDLYMQACVKDDYELMFAAVKKELK